MAGSLIAPDGGPAGLPKLYLDRSPNHYAWTFVPRGIVIHETEGAYAGAVSWFGQAASQVSAHAVLKEDGSEATQCVPWTVPAWHAMHANGHCIGLELAGFTAQPNDPAQLERASRIVGYWCTRYNIPPRQGDAFGYGGIVRHSDLGAYGGSHHDPGGFDWPRFIQRCAAQVKRGGYRPAWGIER